MDIDFQAKTAAVTMQPGKTLTRQDCDKALDGTRYKVTSFEAAAGN